MVKEYLSQKGINFVNRDVTTDPAAGPEMVQRTGQRGVPVTVINGEAIIGYDVARLEQALARSQQAANRPAFGAAIADADKITARQGQEITYGAYLGKINPGSKAEKLGLAAGDIVIEISGQHIGTAGDMEAILPHFPEGSKIKILFKRNGLTHTAEGTI
jgi:glutaredoxin 3